MKLSFLLFSIIFFKLSFANETLEDFSGIWSIKGSSQKNRWVVINNIDHKNDESIYHIEVLSRKKSAPLWQVEHLVPHMAITKAALTRSIIKQLKKGAVYPETYNTAYYKWQSENHNTGGLVCTTSIEQCIIRYEK